MSSMSTLKEKLDRIRLAFEAKARPEALAIMHQAAADLRQTWSLAPSAQPGAPFPEFALPDTDGNVVRSTELLSKGPLITTFYRGMW